jgi:hypothetical protein
MLGFLEEARTVLEVGIGGEGFLRGRDDREPKLSPMSRRVIL